MLDLDLVADHLRLGPATGRDLFEQGIAVEPVVAGVVDEVDLGVGQSVFIMWSARSRRPRGRS